MFKGWTKLVDLEIPNKQSFQFWNGMNVWIERPHILNRKLLATEILRTCTYSRNKRKLGAYDECIQTFLEVAFTVEDFYEELNTTLLRESCTDQNQSDDENRNFTVVLRKLIPRNSVKFDDVMEVVVRDEKENVVTFWPKRSDVVKSSITPSFPYQIKLCDDKIVIESYRKHTDNENISNVQASEDWLKSLVLPKLMKWCCFAPAPGVLPSLNLVSAKLYSVNYSYLKGKYGKKYVEIWTENSDPLKYVYEDCAIAAYLMTLWEQERIDLHLSSKQTFVDLGCGNGLLVDILTSEGYVGIGVDVRRRKIWDLYEDHTVLFEKAIEPSDYNIFPNYDWIIGNHSDELTPWIPVIAARSSYMMRVFLLPCCAYTFNGKFERSYKGQTQYQSYLSFIHLLCESVGFIVQEDKLRIPSTKRHSFICMSRNYKEEDENKIDLLRKDFIQNHSKKIDKVPSTSGCDKSKNHSAEKQEIVTESLLQTNVTCWIDDFKPRERVELVQNCSQLDRQFLEDTVLMVAKMLLDTENYIPLQRGSEKITWNAGGKFKLGDLIKKIDTPVLKCMKKQCGGFQTFLRNHRSVFQIIDGEVQLTVPIKGIPLNSKPAGRRKRRQVKQYCFQEKPCFFFFHHPQGCPLEDCNCSFSHQFVKN